MTEGKKKKEPLKKIVTFTSQNKLQYPLLTLNFEFKVNISNRLTHSICCHPTHVISYTDIKATLGLQMGKWKLKSSEYPTETLIIHNTYSLENTKKVYHLVLLSQDVYWGQARDKKKPS